MLGVKPRKAGKNVTLLIVAMSTHSLFDKSYKLYTQIGHPKIRIASSSTYRRIEIKWYAVYEKVVIWNILGH